MYNNKVIAYDQYDPVITHVNMSGVNEHTNDPLPWLKHIQHSHTHILEIISYGLFTLPCVSSEHTNITLLKTCFAWHIATHTDIHTFSSYLNACKSLCVSIMPMVERTYYTISNMKYNGMMRACCRIVHAARINRPHGDHKLGLLQIDLNRIPTVLARKLRTEYGVRLLKRIEVEKIYPNIIALDNKLFINDEIFTIRSK